MKYYTSTTEYNCEIDLHARQRYVCLMDRQGQKLVHTNIKHNDFHFFLKLVAPYRHDLTVCCEWMFGWYWLADACQAAGLTFVLAHALYVRAIHGGKTKNDRLDSEKLAHLLRSNLLPPAYVYPAEQRPLPRRGQSSLFCTHDPQESAGLTPLRQRLFYVWRRAELLARLHSHQLAHNRTPAKQTRRNPYLRWAFGEAAVIAKRDPAVIGPLAQRLEAKMNGNKFKANTVVALKLARAVYFMLKNKTVFDPERLIAALAKQ